MSCNDMTGAVALAYFRRTRQSFPLVSVWINNFASCGLFFARGLRSI